MQAKHDSQIWIDAKSTLKGIEFAHTIDSFEVMTGQYHIYSMIKNHTQRKLKYLQVNASYLDVNDKEIAQSIGGPGVVLAPGDSAIIDNVWLFPTRDALPYMVKLTVSN